MLDGNGIFLPDIDVAVFGAHGICADEHPLENRMGISLQQRPIHEGAGVPLIRVADDILGPSLGLTGEFPFDSGQKARSPPPSQLGVRDLLDDGIRSHPGEGFGEGLVSPRRNVVLDSGRVDPPAVCQHPSFLFPVERDLVVVENGRPLLGVLIGQPIDELILSKGESDDLRCIAGLHLLVLYPQGFDCNHRRLGTETMASGGPHLHGSRKALSLHFRFQGLLDLRRPIGPASGHTHVDYGPGFMGSGQDLVAEPFHLSDG
jgi:hypothetical protein